MAGIYVEKKRKRKKEGERKVKRKKRRKKGEKEKRQADPSKRQSPILWGRGLLKDVK